MFIIINIASRDYSSRGFFRRNVFPSYSGGGLIRFGIQKRYATNAIGLFFYEGLPDRFDCKCPNQILQFPDL